MTMDPFSNRWLKCLQPRAIPQFRLFCFPYAGAGASVYRTWGQQLSERVEVITVQLPGREDRFREKPFRQVTELVTTLAPLLAERCDVPFVFFGHSLGALIAFELVRHFRHVGGPLPERLLLSARRAPDLADPLPPLSDLTDDDLVRELQRRYGHFPNEIAGDPELRAMFLPTIRADLELIDSYVYRQELPLNCPITVYGGQGDSITRSDLEAWQAQTTVPVRLRMLPGEHFFLDTNTTALLRLVSDDLALLQ